jgi:hypothetical protein
VLTAPTMPHMVFCAFVREVARDGRQAPSKSGCVALAQMK